MHPLLRNPKQFLMAGLLWSPICLGVIILLNNLIDITWWDACLWAAPPMIIEFFICFSTWYICKMTSLYRWNPIKRIWAHIISTIILNGLWLFLIMLYSEMLDLVFKTDTWQGRYLEALPVFFAVGFSLYFIAILAHYLVLMVEKNRQAEQEVFKQKLLAGQAELKALKATVHPHFLFNCLNLLGPLVRTSTTKAQTVISQLSDFLLYSLKYGKQPLVTLQDELDHIKNYLGIESVRLDDRLKLHFDIDEQVLESKVLPLTLLPLVENAIKHGIGQMIEGGTLEISIKKNEDQIRVTITNPYEEPSHPVQGEGLGLETLKQRISAHYKHHGELTISKDGKTFTAELVFIDND